MFYAPQLFDAMGQGASQALLTHVIIGAVNVGTTLVAVFTVDWWAWIAHSALPLRLPRCLSLETRSRRTSLLLRSGRGTLNPR